MIDLTNLLADIKGRGLHASEAEVTFNGDSLDQDYIRALEASTEDVPRLLAALDGVVAGHQHAHKAVEPWAAGYRFTGDHCALDGDHWPCPTVAAVVAALGEGL
jgi:hypothetical protein